MPDRPSGYVGPTGSCRSAGDGVSEGLAEPADVACPVAGIDVVTMRSCRWLWGSAMTCPAGARRGVGEILRSSSPSSQRRCLGQRCHSPATGRSRCPTRCRRNALGSVPQASPPALPARLTRRPTARVGHTGGRSRARSAASRHRPGWPTPTATPADPLFAPSPRGPGPEGRCRGRRALPSPDPRQPRCAAVVSLAISFSSGPWCHGGLAWAAQVLARLKARRLPDRSWRLGRTVSPVLV